VYSEVFKDVKINQTGTFLIDRTVGRDVKFQMDFFPFDRIDKIVFKHPNGTVLASGIPSTSPFIQKFQFLEVSLTFWLLKQFIMAIILYIGITRNKCFVDVLILFTTLFLFWTLN
jgi:hypothetical protein